MPPTISRPFGKPALGWDEPLILHVVPSRPNTPLFTFKFHLSHNNYRKIAQLFLPTSNRAPWRSFQGEWLGI
jgi:hypothetical protein